MMSPQPKDFGVTPTDQHSKWVCRCTLLNAQDDSRCVACGTPKARQISAGRTSPCLGRAASGINPSSDKSRCSETGSSGTSVVTAAKSGGVEPARRGRPSSSHTKKSTVPAESQVKRSSGRASPARTSRSNSVAERSRPGSSKAHNGKDSSSVSSVLRDASTKKSGGARGGETKRAGAGNSRRGGSSSSYTAREGFNSGRPTTSSATAQAVAATGLVRSSSQSSKSSTSTKTEVEEAGDEMTLQAAIVQQQLVEEKYTLKRRSIEAALARSAYSRSKKMKFEDVAIDWCLEDLLQEASERISARLGISSLESSAGVGSTRRGGGRGREGISPGSASGSGSGSGSGSRLGSGEANGSGVDEEELQMSALFPWPPPKPPRYVKEGVYASESSSSTADAGAITNVTAHATAASSIEQQQQTAMAPLLPPFQSINRVAIPEGEAVVMVPQPLRVGNGVGDVGMARSSSSSSGVSDGSCSVVVTSPGSNEPAASGDTYSAIDLTKGGEPFGGGSSRTAGGGGGCDTDSQSADGMDDSASTGTCATTDSYQRSFMSSDRAAHYRAYKAIFKNHGQQPKKRPRSPVVSTPLRLPFPTAPAGVSLAPQDLDNRPPCGDAVGNAQTEEGSEWGWGLLSEDGGGPGTGGRSGAGEAQYRNFRLPYTLIYEQQLAEFKVEVGKLGMRGVRDAMEEFESIQSNTYISKKAPVKDDGESHKCGCRPPPDGQAGCTDACTNRATREECTKQTCGLGVKATCGNRRIQRYTQSKLAKRVEIKDTGAKGIGVVAKVAIPAGSLVGEYIGEVMSEDDWQQRQALLGDSQKHKYVMDLGEGEVIDASQKGTILRFVNHSCGPNAETQKWTIQGKRRIGLFAKEDIKVGDEITFNYCYVRYDEEARECLCGHPNCLQTLGTSRDDLASGDAAGGGEGRGGLGQGSGAGRGRSSKATPKVQDPETGETVRPWLDKEDAENIEKGLIRGVNCRGRFTAKDQALISSKLLFLKRNVRRAVNWYVDEQKALIAQQAQGGEAVRTTEGGGEASAVAKEESETDRCLKQLKDRMTAQQGVCDAFEQTQGGGRVLPSDGSSLCPPSRDGGDTGVSGPADASPSSSLSPHWPPSLPRVRLSILKMQEETLRFGWRADVREGWRKMTAAGAARRAAGAVWSDGVVRVGTGAAKPNANGSDTGAAGVGSNGVSAGAKPVAKRGRGRPRKVVKNVVKADRENADNAGWATSTTGTEVKDFGNVVVELAEAKTVSVEDKDAQVATAVVPIAGSGSRKTDVAASTEKMDDLSEETRVSPRSSDAANAKGSSGTSLDRKDAEKLVQDTSKKTSALASSKTASKSLLKMISPPSSSSSRSRRRSSSSSRSSDESWNDEKDEGIEKDQAIEKDRGMGRNGVENKKNDAKDKLLPGSSSPLRSFEPTESAPNGVFRAASPLRTKGSNDGTIDSSSSDCNSRGERESHRRDDSRPRDSSLRRRSPSAGSSRRSRSRSQQREHGKKAGRASPTDCNSQHTTRGRDDSTSRFGRPERQRSLSAGSSRGSSRSRNRSRSGGESTAHRRRTGDKKRVCEDSRNKSISGRRDEEKLMEIRSSPPPPRPRRRNSRSRSRSNSSRSVQSRFRALEYRSPRSPRSIRSPCSAHSTPCRDNSRGRAAALRGREESRRDSWDRDRDRSSNIRGRNSRVSVSAHRRSAAGSPSRDDSHRSRSVSTRDSVRAPSSTDRIRRRPGDSRDRCCREVTENSRDDSRSRTRPSPTSGRDRSRTSNFPMERNDSGDGRKLELGERGDSRYKERVGQKRLAPTQSRSPQPRSPSRSRSRSRSRSPRSRRREPELRRVSKERASEERASKVPKLTVGASPGVSARALTIPAVVAAPAAAPEVSAAAAATAGGTMPVKFSDARPTQASPRIIVSASTKPPAAGSAVSAAEVMAAMAAADGYDSDSSDVSDTEVAAMRSIIRQHGADWREKPEIEPEDLLAEEKETIKIRALQERGQLPRDEDPTVNKPRVIAGKMIQNASRKLPREVHRKILDIFQVIILEPYYYPPECKGEPPAFVIGPPMHVEHAERLLRVFHSKKSSPYFKEPTVMNVMKMSMTGILHVHRANRAHDYFKRARTYDVTPQQAEHLSDRRALAWLSSECCRLTGASSMSASRVPVLRKSGATMCKLTIVGTPRQSKEAWAIVQAVLLRYDLVTAFAVLYPAPDDYRPDSDDTGTDNTAAAAAPPTAPATPSSTRPRLGFGQGMRARELKAASAVTESSIASEAAAAPVSLSPPKEPSAVNPNYGEVSSAATTADSSPSGANLDVAAGASAPATVLRKKLQFGQGYNSGFKPVALVADDSKNSPKRAPATPEWVDDGWGLPPGEDDRKNQGANACRVGQGKDKKGADKAEAAEAPAEVDLKADKRHRGAAEGTKSRRKGRGGDRSDDAVSRQLSKGKGSANSKRSQGSGSSWQGGDDTVTRKSATKIIQKKSKGEKQRGGARREPSTKTDGGSSGASTGHHSASASVFAKKARSSSRSGKPDKTEMLVRGGKTGGNTHKSSLEHETSGSVKGGNSADRGRAMPRKVKLVVSSGSKSKTAKNRTDPSTSHTASNQGASLVKKSVPTPIKTSSSRVPPPNAVEGARTSVVTDEGKPGKLSSSEKPVGEDRNTPKRVNAEGSLQEKANDSVAPTPPSTTVLSPSGDRKSTKKETSSAVTLQEKATESVNTTLSSKTMPSPSGKKAAESVTTTLSLKTTLSPSGRKKSAKKGISPTATSPTLENKIEQTSARDNRNSPSAAGTHGGSRNLAASGGSSTNVAAGGGKHDAVVVSAETAACTKTKTFFSTNTSISTAENDAPGKNKGFSAIAAAAAAAVTKRLADAAISGALPVKVPVGKIKSIAAAKAAVAARLAAIGLELSLPDMRVPLAPSSAATGAPVNKKPEEVGHAVTAGTNDSGRDNSPHLEKTERGGGSGTSIERKPALTNDDRDEQGSNTPKNRKRSSSLHKERKSDCDGGNSREGSGDDGGDGAEVRRKRPRERTSSGEDRKRRDDSNDRASSPPPSPRRDDRVIRDRARSGERQVRRRRNERGSSRASRPARNRSPVRTRSPARNRSPTRSSVARARTPESKKGSDRDRRDRSGRRGSQERQRHGDSRSSSRGHGRSRDNRSYHRDSRSRSADRRSRSADSRGPSYRTRSRSRDNRRRSRSRSRDNRRSRSRSTSRSRGRGRDRGRRHDGRQCEDRSPSRGGGGRGAGKSRQHYDKEWVRSDDSVSSSPYVRSCGKDADREKVEGRGSGKGREDDSRFARGTEKGRRRNKTRSPS